MSGMRSGEFQEELHDLIIAYAGREGTQGIIVAMRRVLRSFVEQERKIIQGGEWITPDVLTPDDELPKHELATPA